MSESSNIEIAELRELAASHQGEIVAHVEDKERYRTELAESQDRYRVVDEQLAAADEMIAENAKLQERLDVYEAWKRDIEDSGDESGWARVHHLQAELAELREPAQLQPEPHTEGMPDKWLILATRILGFMEREDVSDGLENEYAELREWKEAILGCIQRIPEYTTGELAGDKDGWGFSFELIKWQTKKVAELRDENERLQEELKTAQWDARQMH